MEEDDSVEYNLSREGREKEFVEYRARVWNIRRLLEYCEYLSTSWYLNRDVCIITVEGVLELCTLPEWISFDLNDPESRSNDGWTHGVVKMGRGGVKLFSSFSNFEISHGDLILKRYVVF